MRFQNFSPRALGKPFLLLSLFTGVGLASVDAHAKEYYVAPTGNNSNPGTVDQPFATLQKGNDVAVAGDTVYLRGGTYSIVTPTSTSAGIQISKSGTSDANRIKFWAYNGEVPILDFSKMVISTTGYTVGISVTGSWLHFKGLEVRNVPMNTRSNTGMSVDASNDIFELLNFHHINGTGLFFSHGTGGHLVLNCDSHDNYDPTSSQGAGQNADGFGAHYQETGSSIVFRGCRAWWNSDDGYDLISQEVPVIFENSWAMGNGYIDSGTAKPGSGNGNGFKAGSSKKGIRHVIRQCLAWKNVAAGFYANHSSCGNDWLNNTSYSNGTQYNLLASTWDANDVRTDGVTLTGAKAHKMRNNIGFPNKNTNMMGVDTTFNTWDLNLTPAAGDFISVSDTGFMGPRQPDGSLPNLDFMKLKAGSQLIDKGTNVALPYVGAAPDLGAYEFGAVATGGMGAGGAVGTGGVVGTGGAVGSGGQSASGGAATAGAAGRAGGTSTSGGNANSGGTASSGAGPTGGASGGAPANGGGAGVGGAVATTGGVPGSGGSNTGSITGGTSAAGAGGALVTSSGGAPSTPTTGGNPTGNGGAPGGSAGANGAGAGVAGPSDGSEASGCSCRLGATSQRDSAGALLALLGLLGAVVRRKQGRARN